MRVTFPVERESAGARKKDSDLDLHRYNELSPGKPNQGGWEPKSSGTLRHILAPERLLAILSLCAISFVTFAFVSLPKLDTSQSQVPKSFSQSLPFADESRIALLESELKVLSREEAEMLVEMRRLREKQEDESQELFRTRADLKRTQQLLLEGGGGVSSSSKSALAGLRGSSSSSSNSDPHQNVGSAKGVLTAAMRQKALFDEHGCSSGQLWDQAQGHCAWMTSIPRLPSITPDELDYYFNIGRPFIVKDMSGSMTEWKASRDWTPEKLKARYGNATVNVQMGRSTRPDFETAQHLLRVDMPFKDFIDKSIADEKPNDLYLTANNNLLHRREMQGMMKDMEPFFPGFLYVDPQQTHFWLGAKSVKTPLHYDPITLFHIHVKGRKLWKFWPPEMEPLMYHTPAVYSKVDAYSPDLKKFPEFAKAHSFYDTIEEGETIFLPTGWWHTVDCLDTPTITVSVTSFVGKFHKFENKLRAKWPMMQPNQPDAQRNGPALPGQQTPKTFDIHQWMVTIATKHLQHEGGVPITYLDWSDTNRDNPEDFRDVIRRYSEEEAVDRHETVVYLLLNPMCSNLVFDWQAWVIENLGLKNSLSSILEGLGREANPPALLVLRDMFKKCLPRGTEIFGSKELDAMKKQHNDVMTTIRANQEKLRKAGQKVP
mmetsp:Transcript_17235/g.23809  ORF Transcript_17235/g.23809 Transcript_17235/m.23809 type:complete len:658 (-) Transcript_17235:214-2187(-)|eukprot:CAMPEP_0196582664 /NCGR_PEP_ID=MMETSP1081-20130531/40024_1 /TAXON_ID=36882 /ORGANISM="Pyramimonas amylifera, Strain CCMP720" /LENGTH=657 /DNA_ID=CAMNT_0041903299 /DNA_START=204 /DNA_END=2180 /DNA_ORIENTATION=+